MGHGLRQGQIVVTEGKRTSLISKLIAWNTGSWWTHCFLVTNKDRAIESKFPKVTSLVISERLAQLEDEDRAYVVFEHTGLSIQQRWKIAAKAESYIGKWYDIGQVLLFAQSGRFWNDGVGTLCCSRLPTAVYSAALGMSMFTQESIAQHYAPDFARSDNLLSGHVTPADYFASTLRVVRFKPSMTIPDLPSAKTLSEPKNGLDTLR